jgi:hypothetical protein
MVGAFPYDFPVDARREVLQRIGDELFGQRGLPWSSAAHDADPDADVANPHFHLDYGLLPMARQPDGSYIVSNDLRTDLDGQEGLRFPYAADDSSPIMLVSTRRDEHILVGPRGLLERRPGKPGSLGTGKARAMRRIRRAAATMADRLADNNVFLPRGDAWREPPASSGDTIIRFG